jgi:hypothetical protein
VSPWLRGGKGRCLTWDITGVDAMAPSHIRNPAYEDTASPVFISSDISPVLLCSRIFGSQLVLSCLSPTHLCMWGERY